MQIAHAARRPPFRRKLHDDGELPAGNVVVLPAISKAGPVIIAVSSKGMNDERARIQDTAYSTQHTSSRIQECPRWTLTLFFVTSSSIDEMIQRHFS